MAIQSDETLVTKGDLKTLFSDKIAPYLGQNLTLRTNVSDYYSTDEKIVGVWTDGRPLYQITYNFTMPSANVDYTIGTLPTGANPKQMFGGIEWAANSYIEVNYYDSSAPTSCLCYVHQRVIKIMGRDQDLANRPAFVTVKYTKSSDAANSAVATPGCYDINRPDLQPANKEIFFGNGLYGQRFTGTITADQNVQVSTELLPAGTPAVHVVNWGGYYVYSNAGGEFPIGSTWSTISYNHGIDNMTQQGRQMNFGNSSGSPRTNAPYNIQVTYTK